MLPDFCSLKKQLLRRVNKNIRQIVAREAGFVGTISKTRCFEGDRNQIIGSDGMVIQDTPFHEETAAFQIPSPIANKISPEEVQKRLIEMAKEMAVAQKRYFYRAMNNIIDESGNTINANGAKFSVELFLQCLEKIELDFNPNGTPQFPTLIMHPDMQKLAYEELSKIENEPTIKKRHDAILQTKRSEWIARENNRKLAG